MFKKHNGPLSLTGSLIYTAFTALKIVSKSHYEWQMRDPHLPQDTYWKRTSMLWIRCKSRFHIIKKKFPNRNRFSHLTLISCITEWAAQEWTRAWQSQEIWWNIPKNVLRWWFPCVVLSSVHACLLKSLSLHLFSLHIECDICIKADYITS